MQVPSEVVAARLAAVARHGGNISAAARELGLPKSTLWDTVNKASPHKVIPDPKTITRTTTLYDSDGHIRQQWVREQPEEAERLALWQEWAAGLMENMPRAAALPLYEHRRRDDVLTIYPIGDHQQTVFDYPGCTVESFRILAPNDAWAINKGFRSHREMKALEWHRDNGEFARHSVNPLMIKV